MSIKPRDFSRDITLGGEIEREQGYQEGREKVDTWIRTTNNPYGDNAEQASPSFNPIDSLIPAKYNTIERNENWRWYNAHKPTSYDLTPNEQGVGVDPNLVQIGNSPFWRSSNDPVDPMDCERYPNSPYCGGNVGNPFGTVTSAMVIPSSTSCETCITYQPNFLGIPGPATRFCYRKDNDFCKVPVIDEAGDPPVYPPGVRQPLVPKPKAPPGYVRFLYCANFARRELHANVFALNPDIVILNEQHQVERLEIIEQLLSSYSGLNRIAYNVVIEVSHEPGIIRCGFDLFNTTGPKYPESGSVYLHDYGVLPWELEEKIPRWITYSNLIGYTSNVTLSNGFSGPITPGFVNQATQTTFYPPIVDEVRQLSGGIDVQVVLAETYADTSVIWVVDTPCSTGLNEAFEYRRKANEFRVAIENIAKPPPYWMTGSNPELGLAIASYSSRPVVNNWLEFVQVAASSECPIPKREPTPVKEDDPMDCCDEVLEQLELLQIKNSKVYKILGGDRWFKGDSETPDLDIDAETAINTVRSNLYRDDSQADSETVSANDLISLIAAYQAVLYQRSGFHRFPAIVPENLALDPKAGDDPDLSIVDAMSWQEWLVRQIDALQGAWPIKVKYKDEEGEESEIELHNNSEAIAEIYGLLLSVAGDVDIQTELGFKTITEAIAAKVAATTAADYAKGNAEFMGYKGNLKEKKIPMSITPGAKTLKKALEPSEQKVPRWVNEDKLDLVQLLTQILFATEVVKSVFWDTFDPDRGVRGDGIKERREQGDPGDEDSWQEFINELRNPTGIRYSDLFPKPDINNLPQEEKDGN